MTVELDRVQAGFYITPDHRWKVRSNSDGRGCAPRTWWILYFRNVRFPLQAQNLRTAKEIIARFDDPAAK